VNIVFVICFLTLGSLVCESLAALPSKCSAAHACATEAYVISGIPNDCDPQSLIVQHEGCCLCAYVDKKEHPTIGIGFNLDTAAAKGQIANLGLDFNAVYSGTQCITNAQVTTLFQYSLAVANKQAAHDVATFSQLCCEVQNVIVDMVFNLGSLGDFHTFLGYINTQQWDMAAKDLKYATLWCGQVGDRCTDNMARIEKGCTCFGQFTAACSGPACCTKAALCCNTLKPNWSNAAVTRCCTTDYPNCCGNNPTSGGCCGSGYKNCCTNFAGTCCGDNTPVCCGPFPDGWCCPAGYTCGVGVCTLDGKFVEGMPANRSNTHISMKTTDIWF